MLLYRRCFDHDVSNNARVGTLVRVMNNIYYLNIYFIQLLSTLRFLVSCEFLCFLALSYHRVRSEEVGSRAGIERELASRADQRVLRWFGHVETMDEYPKG